MNVSLNFYTIWSNHQNITWRSVLIKYIIIINKWQNCVAQTVFDVETIDVELFTTNGYVEVNARLWWYYVELYGAKLYVALLYLVPISNNSLYMVSIYVCMHTTFHKK